MPVAAVVLQDDVIQRGVGSEQSTASLEIALHRTEHARHDAVIEPRPVDAFTHDESVANNLHVAALAGVGKLLAYLLRAWEAFTVDPDFLGVDMSGRNPLGVKLLRKPEGLRNTWSKENRGLLFGIQSL